MISASELFHVFISTKGMFGCIFNSQTAPALPANFLAICKFFEVEIKTKLCLFLFFYPQYNSHAVFPCSVIKTLIAVTRGFEKSFYF
jgi:hypothetical protein